MSESHRGPRLVLDEEARPAPRLDFGWEGSVVPLRAARPGLSTPALMLAGLLVLLLGLSALDAANFVQAQFARATWLGVLTLAVAGAGYGLILAGVWREARGLLSLQAVDRARSAFARRDDAAARREAVAWAERIPAAASSLPALRAAPDAAALAAVLEAGPLPALAAEAGALGRAAAMQAFAVTAVSPSPGLDALVFGWRGVRLVRQVAQLHGLRPGLLGTLALLRRTALDAAAVAATDVAVDAVVRAVMSSPMVAHVAGETAAGAVAARRMVLLARAADEACRILPRS